MTTNGVCLYVSILVHDYNGSNSNEVDVSEILDCDGDGSGGQPLGDNGGTVDPENIYNHDVTVTFVAEPYGETGTSSKYIRVTGYQIDYTANVGTEGTDVPRVDSTAVLAPANPITMNVGGTTTSNFVLFDINQKSTFLGEQGVTWDNATYPTPSYTADFTFFAKDEFDNDIQAFVSTQALIGEWDYCAIFGII